MLVAKYGEKITIYLVYKSGYQYVDPSEDILVFLKRGFNSSGPIIIRAA